MVGGPGSGASQRHFVAQWPPPQRITHAFGLDRGPDHALLRRTVFSAPSPTSWPSYQNGAYCVVQPNPQRHMDHGAIQPRTFRACGFQLAELMVAGRRVRLLAIGPAVGGAQQRKKQKSMGSFPAPKAGRSLAPPPPISIGLPGGPLMVRSEHQFDFGGLHRFLRTHA